MPWTLFMMGEPAGTGQEWDLVFIQPYYMV